MLGTEACFGETLLWWFDLAVLRLWSNFLVVLTMLMAMEKNDKNDGNDPNDDGCVAATFSS